MRGFNNIIKDKDLNINKNTNKDTNKDTNKNNFPHRCTVDDYNNTRFFQLPKFLFDEELKEVSNDAKMLYAILKDRHNLSRENNWIDENGHIYLICTRKNMAEFLGASIPTVRKACKELVKYNLIEEVQQGLCNPNKIYLLAFDMQKNLSYEPKDKKILIDNVEKTFHSGQKKSFIPEEKNVSPNNTNINNTDINNTSSSQQAPKQSLAFAQGNDNSDVFISFPLKNKDLYFVSDRNVVELSNLYPNVDIKQQLRNMRGWLDANPRKRKSYEGVDRFINSWLTKEQRKFKVEVKGQNKGDIISNERYGYGKSFYSGSNNHKSSNNFNNFQSRELDFEAIARKLDISNGK